LNVLLSSGTTTVLFSVSSYDATEEAVTGASYGRLVNHGDKNERNCHMKVICVEKVPYLCLFATKDIPTATELLFDYGIPDTQLPWKRKVCIDLFVIALPTVGTVKLKTPPV